MRRWRRLFRYSLSSLLLAGLLTEFLSRSLPTGWTPSRTTLLQKLAGDHVLIDYGVVPGWDISPDGGRGWGTDYHTNRWWMRGPDYENIGSRYIFVGDSATFGVGLEWEQTWAARFEQLREAGRPGTDIQTALCASPGHSSAQSKVKLREQCLDFEPGIVVIASLFNDATRAELSDQERFALARPSFPGRFLEHSAFYRLLRATLLHQQPAQLLPQSWRTQKGTIPRVKPEDYEANLLEMLVEIRTRRALPVLLVLPTRNDTRGQSPNPTTQEYRDILKKISNQEGVLLVDAASPFSAQGAEVFSDPVHPGPEGARRIGEILEQKLP